MGNELHKPTDTFMARRHRIDTLAYALVVSLVIIVAYVMCYWVV
jgi:hypothetical protein